MGRVRHAIAAAVVGAAIAAQGAVAQDTPPLQSTTEIGGTPQPPAGQTTAPVVGGIGSAQPPKQAPKPQGQAPKPQGKSGAGAGNKGKVGSGGTKAPAGPPQSEPGGQGTGANLPPASPPALSSASCTASVPPTLLPIYQQASDRYGLGPAGPSILAAINEIESGFGTNMGPSSAGAIGWMQFLPSTWAVYGVDADGDGKANPWDAEDAIFAAARYLRAAGMPEDPEGAIYAYNNAEWYVAEVLSLAACYNGLGSGSIGGVSLLPERQQLTCVPAKPLRNEIPDPYMQAFEAAATRYDLGDSGVWALAAVARLESNFGRGMSKVELAKRGPLGISQENWLRYAVDGDGDGRIVRQSPADSAATLARIIWASGSLRAGIFLHNHAEWYVQEVLDEADRAAGECQVHTVSYSISLPGPIGQGVNWDNVQFSNALEVLDVQRGAIDPRIINLMGLISREHTFRISALRSDHSMYTSSGSVSNHYYGRAMDIAAVDGVSCTVTSPDGPCGRIARALAALPPGVRPTELIYCFDPDGPTGPAWAQADHCDHVHVGFDG